MTNPDEALIAELKDLREWALDRGFHNHAGTASRAAACISSLRSETVAAYRVGFKDGEDGDFNPETCIARLAAIRSMSKGEGSIASLLTGVSE